jgi:hypothetical protein
MGFLDLLQGWLDGLTTLSLRACVRACVRVRCIITDIHE